MANQSIDPKKLAAALQKASGGKISNSSISAAQNGDPSALLSALNERDRQKINRLLGDEKALQRLLSDEQTKKLLKELSGNG